MAHDEFLLRYYPESKFGGFSDCDGTVAFYTRVHALLRAQSIVLDLGCGRGAHFDKQNSFQSSIRNLKGKCARIIGLDVDRAAQSNIGLDEFRLMQGDSWPIESNTIDLCICDYVLEHVKDPARFFNEVRRVLKPEGYLCIRTSNVFSYFGLLSRLIPNTLHALVLNKVQRARKSEDVFPAFYRCNTPWKINAYFRKYGFAGYAYGYEAEPSYLSWNRWVYLLGVLHQRFAPRCMRVSIFAYAQKHTQASIALER